MVKKLVAMIVAMVLTAVVFSAGCTNNISLSNPTASQYADAYHTNIQNKLGANENLTVWRQAENGSDAMSIGWTVVNSTRKTQAAIRESISPKEGTYRQLAGLLSQFDQPIDSQSIHSTMYNDVPKNTTFAFQQNKFVVWGTGLFFQDGTKVSYNATVKVFPSTDEATKFFDDVKPIEE